MAEFDKERTEYKEKVGKQKEAIKSLIKLSDSHSDLIESSVRKQLNVFEGKCERLFNKLDKNEFEIAIVGLEKAGKSTFGNALMKNTILPDADERCTYTSTCIRYGDDRAIVSFFNKSEMDDKLRKYLETLGIEKLDSYTYDTLSSRDYRNLFEDLPEDRKARFENTVNQDILNLLDNKNEILDKYVGKNDCIIDGDDLYGDEIRKYIVDSKIAVAVKEVCIESSKLKDMPNAIIYDVPGFDSPTKMHSDQTIERMKEADAIILIASAEKPSFTAPSLDIFQKVVDEDNLALGDKLFIFGNRADAANTLGKNIETLKKEIVRWNLLDSSRIADRLAIGSAKAHLQKLKLISGDNCIYKIEKDEEYCNAWKYGDGIDYIYDKLVEYNKSERFSVLKKKVLKNNDELKNIFNELHDKYLSGNNGVNVNGILSESTELKYNAKTKIIEALEQLRKEIRDKYNGELVLSERLQEKINELFENNTYSISDEDIQREELKIEDISGSVNVERVEEGIRGEKFELIYNDFSNSAFAVAQNDHKTYYDEIVQIFEKALRINPQGADYEKIHNIVIAFIEKYKKNTEDEFIYQSLIERFVRDVVEVLIRKPYSSEARLNKFIYAEEVFSGLSMFYDHGNAKEGYKNHFLSIAPKDQPLLLSLVFHDYKDADDSSQNIISSLSNAGKEIINNPEIIRLAFNIIKLDPVNAVKDVRGILSKYEAKRETPNKDKIIFDLGNVGADICKSGDTTKNSNMLKYSFDFTDKEEFEKQYKQFFGNMPVRSYDNTKEFFEDDLQILKKFLIHACIPAIRLETPFVSREVQSINALINAVDSRMFADFIDNNCDLLIPKSMDEFNRKMSNFIANKEVVKQIDDILSTLNYI